MLLDPRTYGRWRVTITARREVFGECPDHECSDGLTFSEAVAKLLPLIESGAAGVGRIVLEPMS